MADAGSDATISSVICRFLLFDNVELAKAKTDGAIRPVVPPSALIPQQ